MTANTDPGEAWRANAGRVARWYLDNLVVRTDRYGYHKAKSRAVSAGPLTPEVATAHVHARTRADVIGGLTVVEVDGVCYGKETALDVDAHDATPEQIVANEAAAVAWYTVLVNLGYDPLLTTEGGGGYHLRAIHKQLQEARKLQALGRWLCADWAARGACPGATGTGPEVYPKQYKLRGKKLRQLATLARQAPQTRRVVARVGRVTVVGRPSRRRSHARPADRGAIIPAARHRPVPEHTYQP